MRRATLLAIAAIVPLAACNMDLTGLASPDAPGNLAYQLIPSGNPDAPLGILLTWMPPSNGYAVSYDVYARNYTSGQWTLRGTTTSPSFHDAGTPELQYYVQALDGNGADMGRSDPVTVDDRQRLPAPAGLHSITLNTAIQLAWDDNAVHATTAQFDYYRVYSSPFDGTSGYCSDAWVLEGTTVSDAFLSANLPNGVKRCYAVTAVSQDGHESQWSDVIADTPRYDAKSILVYATDVKSDSSAFLFYDATVARYGVVSSATRLDADVVIQRAGDGSLTIAPARAAVTMQTYSGGTISDLTAVNSAPSAGYATTGIAATPSFGYLFRVQQADGVHYGAMRVVMVTHDYVLIDWSYQSAANDPQLDRQSTSGHLMAAP